jgi:hypothetical protein
VDSRAFVGESELSMRYRYATLPRFQIELFVDLSATGGDAGSVDVEVKPQGFDVVRGPLRWSKNVGEGDTESNSVVLSASGEGLMKVDIVTTRSGGVELANDELRFIVDKDEDIVRECRPTDPPCQ